MKTIKNRNLNGRPRKSKVEKLAYKITVKFATAEYYVLRSKAKATQMTISEYVRTSIKYSVVKERLRPSHHKYILQLIGMANNLNQIARTANRAGYDKVHTECLRMTNKIDQTIKLIENGS